ncbi:hypothetical protein BRAO375_1370003 [Bradyrhizobium sp. ORS 375]|nr:hypothetical protein BRAO375_1370003 [Bradyrhizobium sp. ORS 375]
MITAVIASEAKQSRGVDGTLDCFVASLLAMTTKKRLYRARTSRGLGVTSPRQGEAKLR